MRVPFVLLLLCWLPCTLLADPSGRLTGAVVDSTFGARLSGVTIYVEGTALGAVSRPDGTFAVKLPVGSYTIRAHTIGFGDRRFTGVRIGPDSVTHLSVVLSPQALAADTIVVEAAAERGTQTSILVERRNAASVVDGVAAEQMRASPDATSGDAIRRVTGVSLNDSKFVSVRGIGERYNIAQLNHTALTSTDADRKAFSFDLIPSTLIENLTVSKSFTPDQPGNFSGGLVQITTVSFPETFSGRLSISAGLNGLSTFKTVTTHAGGGTDWLGLDDGSRALPAGFPSQSLATLNLTSDQRRVYGQSFANNWEPKRFTAPPNGNAVFTLGDAVSVFDRELGYIAALSYRSGVDHSDIRVNDYNPDGTPVFERSGARDTRSVQWGALLNTTYRPWELGTISLRNIFTQTGDDEVVTLAGNDYDHAEDDRLTSFHYTQRSVYSGQLSGDHAFPSMGGLGATWRIGVTSSNRQEPDFRRYQYVREMGSTDPYYASIGDSPDPSSGGRFFSSMFERNVEEGFDVTVPLRALALKVGAVNDNRTRAFDARVLAFRLRGSNFSLLYSAIDTLFAPQHISTAGFEIDEITNPSDHYEGHERVTAAYAMADLPLAIDRTSLRIVAGARVEDAEQRLQSGILGGGEVDYRRQHREVLPAVSTNWMIPGGWSVRASASQTVSRPEFREIAPFAFYDFALGTLVQGNPAIDQVRTRNLDCGVEFAPSAGETFSARLFHRRFDGPIEETDEGSNSVRSWANAPSPANLYGFELEIRKSLGFLGEAWSGLWIAGNYSWMHSSLDVHALTNGQENERPMQGQAPYILNLSVNYALPSSGTDLTLLYNRTGARLSTVNPYSGDEYEQPRDVVDISLSQPLWTNLELTYKAKDLLGMPLEFKSEGRVVRSVERGVTHALAISLKF